MGLDSVVEKSPRYYHFDCMVSYPCTALTSHRKQPPFSCSPPQRPQKSRGNKRSDHFCMHQDLSSCHGSDMVATPCRLWLSQKAVPLPSSLDNHQHRGRAQRPSPDRRSSDPEPRLSPDQSSRAPDRRSCDPELQCLSSKKKSDHNYDDLHRYRDHCDEYYQDSHRHSDRTDYRHHEDHPHRSGSSCHNCSESAAKPSSKPPAAPKPISAADKKQKVSVFSRISFPAEDQAALKKRNLSSSTEAQVGASGSHGGGPSNGYYEDHKTASSTRKSSAPTAVDYESSDDDRHFKRRSSRNESSLPKAAAMEGGRAQAVRERERGTWEL